MNNQESPEPGPQEEAVAEVEAAATKSPAVPPPKLQAVKLTDVGRVRSHNEDYVDFYIPPDARQLERKGAIYLVADGMGGHQAGEVASQGAVELVIGQYYSDTTHDVGTSLVRAFRAANKLIYDQAQADPTKAGMGTTLVAAVILGRKVYLANVGDSRAYLINKAGIVQITEDHSWVEEQVRAGLLTSEQAAHHPQRNLVTRALGTKPSVDVDLFEGELGKGDFLLLCSDGLTGRVEDQEIASLIAEHPLGEAARLLVALANERGGNDNITVLIVGVVDEVPTVAAPVAAPAAAAPIAKRQTREFPWIPVLAGVAGLLVIVLAGLLIAPLLFKGEPTPVPVVSPLAPTEPLAPAIEATLTLAATEAPLQSPSAEVVPPEAPSPEATLAPGEPTATLAATFTPAPPTPTPRPTQPRPTATERPPTATSEPPDTAPTLESPAAEAELQGMVTFSWSYGRLALRKAFQVLIWKEGEKEHYGAADFTRQRQQQINLDDVSQVRDGGPGVYYWTVVVVDKKTEARLSSDDTGRRFTYLGPPGEKEEPKPPGQQPTPTPRP